MILGTHGQQESFHELVKTPTTIYIHTFKYSNRYIEPIFYQFLIFHVVPIEYHNARPTPPAQIRKFETKCKSYDLPSKIWISMATVLDPT
jgi:hypothetical protein